MLEMYRCEGSAGMSVRLCVWCVYATGDGDRVVASRVRFVCGVWLQANQNLPCRQPYCISGYCLCYVVTVPMHACIAVYAICIAHISGWFRERHFKVIVLFNQFEFTAQIEPMSSYQLLGRSAQISARLEALGHMLQCIALLSLPAKALAYF